MTKSPRNYVLIVVGTLVGLIGLVLLAGGGALLWANQTLKDDDGYFTSRTATYANDGRAIASENLDLGDLPGGSGRWGELRIRATGGGDRPVFVGIGPRDDVQRYLLGVRYAELTDVDLDPFRPTYQQRTGTRAPAPPDAQGFWVARAQGNGEQTLKWGVDDGDWQIVAMNQDASAGVALHVSLGVKVAHVIKVVIGLLVAGSLMLGGGILMIVSGGRRRDGPPHAEHAADGTAAGTASLATSDSATSGVSRATYPVDLTGELDAGLSRWQWLVKWLLAIPHYIVLLFLWIAYSVVTVIAFFAILFTGRYPRGLFDFNAGVLRWSWRVGFYFYSALATDRYPPFTLAKTDYPADIEVPYPEQLSRGLVLVKWWLLAIPHYIVVAILVGNWTYGAAWGEDWWGWAWTPAGGGLIGVLVLFAAIALLFTGRYPRSLFDLVIGMNRWVYRVIAYTTLMRDEYPPFRLER